MMASENMMAMIGLGDNPRRLRSLLAITVACAGVAGCAASGRPSDAYLAQHGYWYHDANHDGGRGGVASPQAIYNATHGTYLWPPAEVDVPD
jgi:hypothetical protein